MKKLLILMLVLGMVSVASADLTLSVSGNDVSVEADSMTADLYAAVSITGGSIGTFAVGDEGGTMCGYLADGTDVGLPNGEIWALAIGVPPEVYQDGSWLTAVISYTGSATVNLWEMDDEYSLTLLDSVVVPEPMTLALLGLGGLFLRRRK